MQPPPHAHDVRHDSILTKSVVVDQKKQIANTAGRLAAVIFVDFVASAYLYLV